MRFTIFDRDIKKSDKYNSFTTNQQSTNHSKKISFDVCNLTFFPYF